MIIISHQSESISMSQSIINFIIMQCHVIRNKLRKLKLKLNVEVLKAYEIQGMCVCARMCARVCACMCARVCVCTCVCMYVLCISGWLSASTRLCLYKQDATSHTKSCTCIYSDYSFEQGNGFCVYTITYKILYFYILRLFT